MANNLKSVKGMEHIGRGKTGKKLKEGWILGPFPNLPLAALLISLLNGSAQEGPWEYHLIHNPPYPHRGSVE